MKGIVQTYTKNDEKYVDFVNVVDKDKIYEYIVELSKNYDPLVKIIESENEITDNGVYLVNKTKLYKKITKNNKGWFYNYDSSTVDLVCEWSFIDINESFASKYNFLKSYHESPKYHNNIDKITELIKSRDFLELCKYTEFDTKHMEYSESLLDFIINCDNAYIINHFIDNVLDLNELFPNNIRLLHLIARYSPSESIKHILTKNIDVNIDNSLCSNRPIHTIAKLHDEKLNLHCLRLNIFDLNCVDKWGNTPLDYILNRFNLEVIDEYISQCNLDNKIYDRHKLFDKIKYNKNMTKDDIDYMHNIIYC